MPLSARMPGTSVRCVSCRDRQVPAAFLVSRAAEPGWSQQAVSCIGCGRLEPQVGSGRYTARRAVRPSRRRRVGRRVAEQVLRGWPVWLDAGLAAPARRAPAAGFQDSAASLDYRRATRLPAGWCRCAAAHRHRRGGSRRQTFTATDSDRVIAGRPRKGEMSTSGSSSIAGSAHISCGCGDARRTGARGSAARASKWRDMAPPVSRRAEPTQPASRKPGRQCNLLG